MLCPECTNDLEDPIHCSSCGWTSFQTSDTPDALERESDSTESQTRTTENIAEMSESVQGAATEHQGTDRDLNMRHPTPSSTRLKGEMHVEGSEIHGDIIMKVGPQEEKENRSLYTDTYEISSAYTDPVKTTGENLRPYVSQLEDKRLLVIGCENAYIAFDAAKALITKLGITDQKRRRGYNVEEGFQQDTNITIQSLLPDKKEAKDNKDCAVVVNALGSSGQSFVNSLLDDFTIHDRLRESSIYLLLVVSPTYLAARRTTLGVDVPRWEISYLKYLLRSYSARTKTKQADLESRIRRQQATGWWATEESKLCYEVKDYIDQDTLIDELKHRDETEPPPPWNSKDVFKDERRIENTVLYVATYFSSVTPGEFCEIVEALLPDREIREEVPPYKDSTTHPDEQAIPNPISSPAVELWHDYKDRFIREYLHETVADVGMTTVVDFTQSTARDSFKNYLGSARCYYVKDQFNLLLQKGFLFHPSTRVSENMIKLTAENALAYPDEFSKDWLVEIIKNLHERYHPDRNGARQRENPLFYFLDRVRFNKQGWGYSRVAELIRALIKVPQKADLVNRCLADLMRLKHYDAVLNLIKRLRFASEFDGLYWLKQLFDRKDAVEIRPQAFSYLYYTLKEANGDIHKTLDKLDSWLPDADTDRRGYSGSAYFALRLFIKYCFETIDRFDANAVSASIDFPLFNLPADTTDEEASRLIDRLVRWLLHPALTGALRESPWIKRLAEVADERKRAAEVDQRKRANRLIAVLLAEWSVILPDRRQPPAINEQEHDAPLETTAAERIRKVFDQFLTRVASQLSETQRKDLITYWEESNRRSLLSPTDAAAPQEREPLAARRKREADRWFRVFSLGQEFRHLTSSTNVT